MPPNTRAPSRVLTASGSTGCRAPKKKPRRALARQALLPSLAAFLLMDGNETHVEDVLVEEYVRRYMRRPETEQDHIAKQLIECIEVGNVTVVRAVMLATLEMQGWALPVQPPAQPTSVPTSVPPSPDGSLPPGAMPVHE